jgi:hypothetical protein
MNLLEYGLNCEQIKKKKTVILRRGCDVQYAFSTSNYSTFLIIQLRSFLIHECHIQAFSKLLFTHVQSYTVQPGSISTIVFSGQQCHFFVALFCFLRAAWIRIQKAALVARRAITVI